MERTIPMSISVEQSTRDRCTTGLKEILCYKAYTGELIIAKPSQEKHERNEERVA